MCEFLARYVRKLHSDRYLKNILRQNIGTSFLDIIGPSDVAYVIALLKNSKEVWLQAPKTEDDEIQEGNKKREKPVFTAGEGKKRVFGETTWSKSGKKYYEFGKSNWRDCFNPKHTDYKDLRNAWDKWINTKARSMVLGSWTRKSIHSVLATREMENEGEEERGQGGRKRKSMDDDSDDNDEDEVEYGSDHEDSPLITVCTAWKKKRCWEQCFWWGRKRCGSCFRKCHY